MKRTCVWGICAGLLVLLAVSTGQAAVIQDATVADFNPQTTDFVAFFGFEPEAYLLTWDNSASNLAPGDFDPTSNPQYGPGGGNPAWLKFDTNGGGGTGGGGTGGGGGGDHTGNIDTFQLGNNLGGDWKMDFSVCIFDPDFAGTSVIVHLLGQDEQNPNNNYKMYELDADAVKSGKMLTWHIDADAGEEVTVFIEGLGGETHAAGFFMANPVVQALAPEPATLAMLTLGAGSALAARRRRRRR